MPNDSLPIGGRLVTLGHTPSAVLQMKK